jgi:hypothetical protein
MKSLMFLSVLFIGATMQASDLKSYQSGVLKEMTSVECGFEQKSGNTFVGEVLGTDGSHSRTRKTLCHEYVLQTSHVVYHIRPRDEKHPALLPVGETAHFRMKKDLMVLRVPEGDDKERDYDVVGMTPVEKDSPAAMAQSKK